MVVVIVMVVNVTLAHGDDISWWDGLGWLEWHDWVDWADNLVWLVVGIVILILALAYRDYLSNPTVMLRTARCRAHEAENIANVQGWGDASDNLSRLFELMTLGQGNELA